MKIKLLIRPLMLEIVTIILVLLILLVPYTIVHIIAGIPLILFLPGYALLSSLFHEKKIPDGLAQITLCFGMSLAISALLGLGLNNTPWGKTLDSVLYSLAVFIIIMSSIALFVQWGSHGTPHLTEEVDIKLPGWDGSILNKSLSIIVLLSVLTTFGVLSYTVLVPKVGEHFTEFYILGLNGDAQNYPTTFFFQGNQVKSVVYGNTKELSESRGMVTLGIVNHEQQTEAYFLKLVVDGEPTNIEFGGATSDVLGNITLKQGEKWQNTIGFIPEHVGDNQRVEFILMKGNVTTPYNTLYLWIDVKEAN